MVIIVEEFFIEQLQKCPSSFQQKFRVAYQQLKIVDTPTEVKNIYSTSAKNYYKLYIDESKIGMKVKDSTLHILYFLYNQYFD
jgi:predicted nucleotide-binding protein (sugar kinase/HSP70/actin superfamily)